jgi:hypothetical protein
LLLIPQLKGLVDELAEAHESYRQPVPPSDAPINQHSLFITTAGRIIRQRETAEARLKQVDPEFAAKHPPAAQEVFGLMQAASLQKAAATSWLRSERVRLLAKYRARHAELVRDIEARSKYYAAGPGPSYQIIPRDLRVDGDNSDLAVTMRSVAPLVTEARDCEQRLLNLDEKADFAKAITEAIKKAGGAAKIAASCKAALIASSAWVERSAQYAAIRAESATIATLENTLRQADPDSRKAVNNRAQLAAAGERLAGLKSAADTERAATVALMLERAATGDVPSADALESLARQAPQLFPPGFGEALAQARCSDAQLPGVVAALLD